MKSKKFMIAILAVCLLSILAFASAADTKTKPADTTTSPSLKKVPKAPQTLCPVCSAKIDKNISIYYKGSKIYFDKQACLEAFFRNPWQFAQKMERLNIEPEKVANYQPKMQDVCPFTRTKIDKQYRIFIDSEDETIGAVNIYFSSAKAFDEFNRMKGEDRIKTIKKLQDFGYKLEPGDTKD